MEKKTILIVDDEPNNIKLLRQILQDRYEVRVALNGAEALERVMIKPIPELILLDIMMPEMDGYEICTKLKSNPLTDKIPVIFVTAMDQVEDETKGFEVGAVDYIQKPISGPVVLARVNTHMLLANQQRACEETIELRTRQLQEDQKAAINMLGEAGHYNDTDTGVHIWRMAAYSRAIAQAAGYPVEKAVMLEMAAPLHDTGKIGIPDSILKAPRKLTDEEWKFMRQHTTIGHTILKKSTAPIFVMASEIALNHHEKWAGDGYPNGLKGGAIPETARIVAIADVFDALTMRRPYKEAWPIEKALATIAEGSGTHFDPNLVELFISIEEDIRLIKREWDDKE